MTTTQPDSLAGRSTIGNDCPTWCQRTDHDADAVSADDRPVHYGPNFGMVTTQDLAGDLRGCLGHLELEELDDLTPAKLRALAADALASAEWLDAHRTEVSA